MDTPRSGARPMARAGSFYPATGARVARELDGFAATLDAPNEREHLVGGLVPHAGWVYSGAIAYRLFARLAANAPRRVVLLGAVHVAGVLRPARGPWAEWEIPDGCIAVDSEFQRGLEERGVIEQNRRAHLGEHSIEVQLPLLAKLCPGVAIVPLAVPPNERSLGLGRAVGELARDLDGDTLVVASTDLTHYGERFYGFAPCRDAGQARTWAFANDERFLDRVVALDAPGALDEAQRNRNACGSGAVAAAIECARVMGATHAEVVEHTTSDRVSGEVGARNFVGYASVLFRRAENTPDVINREPRTR